MNKHIDLAFFTMGEDYLHTVKNILGETEKTGNARIIIRTNQPQISAKEMEKEMEEQTKRSDFNVFVPTIFMFYHGIELMFKGLLKLQKKDFKPNHKISALYSEISHNKESEVFISTIKKYITEVKQLPIIGDFLESNNQSIDSFYEIFRYPSDKDEKNIYNFFQLKYRKEEGVELAKQIIKDINIIMERIVNTYDKTNLNDIEIKQIPQL